MKFIHCADIHTGAPAYVPDNLERTEKVVHAIFSIAAERDIKTVVIAGDLFDLAYPTNEQCHFMERTLLGYDAAGFHIIAISGNHDLIDQRGETAIRYLDIMYEQGRFHNSVITERTVYHQIDDTIFILLVHKPKLFKSTLAEAINNLKNCSIELDYKNVVVVAHELIKGSFLDNNCQSKHGEELDNQNSPFITYYAFGDVHKQQKIGPRAYYSGSPYQTKFGEEPRKGILIVDTDDPDNPEFVPIKSKQLVIVTSKDDIPEDSYVKLKATKLDLDNQDLPDNVLRTEYAREEVELTVNVDIEGELKTSVTKAVLEQLNSPELDDLVTQEVNEVFAETLKIKAS